MHAQQLIHPWQLATTWSAAHRVGVHRWNAHTLPEGRSHYYPSRCVYLEISSMSRMMSHL